MTFNLAAIAAFTAGAFLYALLFQRRERARGWFLLVASIVAIYWLQPPLPIRFAGFILPSLTIGLVLVSWWLTRSMNGAGHASSSREDWIAATVALALVFALSLIRYLPPHLRLTASRPPPPPFVALALIGGALALYLLARLLRPRMADKRFRDGVLTVAFLCLVLLFVLLKSAGASTLAARFWRSLSGQDTSLAGTADLAWLGFSFVSFRLLHTFRDRQSGVLPDLSLREYLTYVIFFPAYTAGPIDRAERFVADLRTLPRLRLLNGNRFAVGLQRIFLGLLKKFVIADVLVQGVSLNPTNAAQNSSARWLWLLLFGYSLRIYLDFSGYSDIAIGIGKLFGVNLPENFSWPYLKTNITSFWQSWHITLSSWARFYVFTPLSRWLLKRRARPPANAIVFAAHLATMITIGLWHGITFNFFIWGLWHAFALTAHKLWSDRTRPLYRRLAARPRLKVIWSTFAWLLTFLYVTLGWLWFALPTPGQSLRVFSLLFGVAK